MSTHTQIPIAGTLSRTARGFDLACVWSGVGLLYWAEQKNIRLRPMHVASFVGSSGILGGIMGAVPISIPVFAAGGWFTMSYYHLDAEEAMDHIWNRVELFWRNYYQKKDGMEVEENTSREQIQDEND